MQSKRAGYPNDRLSPWLYIDGMERGQRQTRKRQKTRKESTTYQVGQFSTADTSANISMDTQKAPNNRRHQRSSTEQLYLWGCIRGPTFIQYDLVSKDNSLELPILNQPVQDRPARFTPRFRIQSAYSNPSNYLRLPFPFLLLRF
jgi:hypothetical protein